MKKTTFALVSSCTALALSLLAGGAQAQSTFAKPEDAVKYRQAAFTLVGSHFGRLAPVVRGQAPFDAAAVQRETALLQQLAALPWDGFAPGTEGGKASPDIWKEQEKFKQLQDRMRGEVDKLAEASKSGELEKVRAAFGGVGASCKACHDAYRQR